MKKDGKICQRVAGFFIPEGVKNLIFEDFSCTRVPTMSNDEVISAQLSKNLTQSECFQSRGYNIRFNRINAYSNYGIGFYFVGFKSYNIAYRCDAYNNKGLDNLSKGNADGFGSHGTGAEFIECRAWDNSDDNYDCINSYGRTIFDSCWAFNINFANVDIQDGNGFKVGGWGKSATAKNLYGPFSGENPPIHIVKNCIATSNKANGFYSNHQPGQAAVWYNNKAYRNKANFDMTEGSETWELDSSGKVVDICGTREILFFNLAHKPTATKEGLCENLYGNQNNLFNANLPDKNNKFNSWNFENIVLVDNDFLSIDKNELAGERGPDGSLPEINFMKLNPEGPNYHLLKTIEDEFLNYEILSDGTIKNKITNKNVSNNDDNNQENSNNENHANNENEEENNDNKANNKDDVNNKENDDNKDNSDKEDNSHSEDNIQNKESSSGLGTGVISGIIVGMVGFIAIISLLIIYFKRKKRNTEELIETELKACKQNEGIKNIEFESKK